MSERTRRKRSTKAAKTPTVATALLELSELDLTKTVVIPLLKSMGYKSVEYHGGPSEMGVDVICRGTDELMNPTIAVAQIKAFKPSARAADIRSFSEIVTQLSQASETPIPSSSGAEILPSCVYFVTPYSIDTRALKSRLKPLSLLYARNIKIVDGPKLEELIRCKLPSLAQALLGPKSQIHMSVESQLNNEVLLRCLHARLHREIRDIYTDIDFAVGKETTRIFANARFKGRSITLNLRQAEWNVVRAIANDVMDKCGIRLLSEHESVRVQRDREFELAVKQWQKWRRAHAKLAERIAQEYATWQTLDSESEWHLAELTEREAYVVKAITGALRASVDGDGGDAALVICDQAIKGLEDIVSAIPSLNEFIDSKKIVPVRSELDRHIAAMVALRRLVREYPANWYRARQGFRVVLDGLGACTTLRPNRGRRTCGEFLVEYLECWLRIRTGVQRAVRIGNESVPCRTIGIAGAQLADFLSSKRDRVRAAIARYNRKVPTQRHLREFLAECHRLFEVCRIAFGNKYVLQALGADKPAKPESEDGFRLCIPLQQVFESRLNLAVFGGAGAGKTTGLQMYASTRVDARREEVILYAPLAKIVRIHQGRARPADPATAVLEGVVGYLNALGSSVTVDDLQRELERPDSVVLLDAVDEAIGGAPWLLEGIEAIARRFPRAQILTSSRTSGMFMESLPFLGVTLLPFTELQRDTFIRRWMKGRKGGARRILEHLKWNQDIAEVVKSPLSATILCVLDESGVPLPRQQTRLYEERLRLLLGYYDVYKEISRMGSDPRGLEILVCKLAYRLHEEERRDAHKDELVAYAFAAMGREWSFEACAAAIEELVYPCNLLVPTSIDGRFGFGHKGYQEHLVAMELNRNRNRCIDVKMVRSEWWRGALVMYAQMADGIHWLLDWTSEHGEREGRETLKQMVAARPKSEQGALRSILERERGRLGKGGSTWRLEDSIGDEEWEEEVLLDLDDLVERGGVRNRRGDEWA